MSPSGKAPDFDSGIRRFEPCHPSHVGAKSALLRNFLCAADPAHRTQNDPLAQQAEQLPFKQWVWSSNLQRVTKKSTTPTGVVLFLRKQRRFERLNPTVRWTVGSQCAHWLILYLRQRRKCKRISSGSPKIGEHCQGLADFYLLPLHDSLFTIIEQPIFGK